MESSTPVEALVDRYEDLLKDAADTISNQQMLIREVKTESDILRHEILHMQGQLRLRRAERDFAEKQLDRIRRALA
jgi:FtsZ-binding cell division protein ZapB